MPDAPSGAAPTLAASTDVEVEVKLGVHGLYVVPDLVDAEAGVASVVPQPPQTLRATYYDTADLRLARDGITLRHRTGEGPARWTLKLPAGRVTTGLSREEISVAGAEAAVPDELRDLLTAWLRGGALLPAAVLGTARQRRLLFGPDGAELAELVDDTVSLLEGRRVVTRFRELEVELREGSPQLLVRITALLVAAGAVPGEQLPKLVRALGPRASHPSDLAEPVDLNPSSSAGDLVRNALRAGLARLVGSDIGVRRLAPDAVHQMRVACRRLRSDLRTFGPLLEDERVDLLRDELAWLADVLGSTRDLEVLRARLLRTATADPLSPLDPDGVAAVDALLAAQQEQVRPHVQEALRSVRYVALLELLVDVASQPGLTALAEQSCERVLPEQVGAVWRAMAKKAARLTLQAPDEDWHRVRILAKRARYAAEAAAAALGGRARRTGRAAASLQELLGEHQDAAVAAERVLALVDGSSPDLPLALTCGRLAERERSAVRAARTAFPAQWRQVRRSGVARWLA